MRLHKEEGLSFKNVTTFNLDEYYPIAKVKHNITIRNHCTPIGTSCMSTCSITSTYQRIELIFLMAQSRGRTSKNIVRATREKFTKLEGWTFNYSELAALGTLGSMNLEAQSIRRPD